MLKKWMLASAAMLSLGLTLSACGQGPGGHSSDGAYESVEASADIAAAPEADFGFSEAMEGSDSGADRVRSVSVEEPVDEGSQSIEPQNSVAAPQIAYRYALGFKLPADAIKPLQERHADMCEARGPNVCRIISMQQSDSDGDYAYGNLQIAVAASVAREFSKQLEASSGSADAELTSSSITGEDLSKQIVDTEARLRARTLLRDRLMEILRTNRGTVEELVEAERGVAQVNQEIDQARSWLNEMRGRVAFSQMSIAYESGSPRAGGFSEPIANAWGALGSILGNIIGFLMMAVTGLLPFALLAFGALRLWKWAQARKTTNEAAQAEDAANGSERAVIVDRA